MFRQQLAPGVSLPRAKVVVVDLCFIKRWDLLLDVSSAIKECEVYLREIYFNILLSVFVFIAFTI